MNASNTALYRTLRGLAMIAALLVSPLLAVAVVFVSGRGSPLPIVADLALGALVLLASITLAARVHALVAIAAAIEALALIAFIGTYRASPLVEPKAYSGMLPPARPPTEMQAYRVSTGSNHRTAAFGYRGGAFSDRREFAMTAVLVRHPRGDLLIDTGFGRRVREHLARMPFGFRLVTTYDVTKPVADQLQHAGYDRARLRGVLLTHAHWDHASGIADLPGIGVLVPRAERQFIADGGWITDVARMSGARFETYAFDGGAYLGFPASHDVHGDGSIVIVPAAGHTPGSVIVFVNLPRERRYAFIGDLAWQLEGITEREERPWLMRTFGDSDPAAVRENLRRVAALHASFPQLVIVPAHDPRGFATLPELPRRLE